MTLPMRCRLLFDGGLLLLLTVLAGAVWAGSRPPPDPTWTRVQRTGILRIGTDPTYPPFESLENGRFTGYDITLGQAIAARLGARADFVPLALDGQYDALLAGQVDMLLSALPFIYERQQEVRYSQPYYQAGPQLVVRAGDSRIGGVADLAGRMVAVELGSDADMAARHLRKTEVPGLVLHTTYHSTAEALAALQCGEADAAITDALGLAGYSEQTRLAVIGPPLVDAPYVAALGRDSLRVAAVADSTIRDLRAAGKLAPILAGR